MILLSNVSVSFGTNGWDFIVYKFSYIVVLTRLNCDLLKVMI